MTNLDKASGKSGKATGEIAEEKLDKVAPNRYVHAFDSEPARDGVAAAGAAAAGAAEAAQDRLSDLRGRPKPARRQSTTGPLREEKRSQG